MEYWVNRHDSNPAQESKWWLSDAVGGLIGFGFGGWWGAAVGAVAGTVAVELFDWDIVISE